MLFLLSPAKSLDYETPVPADVSVLATHPQFAIEASKLIDVLRTKTASDVADLMDLSATLARLNVDRYASWQSVPTNANSKPAVLAFNGDVYDGLMAKSLSLEELSWAQRHLVHLSGLYGALRPLDLLQPYRLEMGTSLVNERGRDLYAFWGDTLASYLNTRLDDASDRVILNLASKEYSRAALRKNLRARVVDCVFEDWKTDRFKVISFYAKRARGLMARWAVQRQVAVPEQLKAFDVDGYALVPELSSENAYVFRRRVD